MLFLKVNVGGIYTSLSNTIYLSRITSVNPLRVISDILSSHLSILMKKQSLNYDDEKITTY
ncbi:hypothetical protein VCHA43P277_160070 [Vibrio chagasii]|nr:hypothetical protein VCHA34P126_140105 [Vibrio chagasii]CAH6983417.1 hypothetical protein VCHA43P277_160070 [Vibrio chagasii]CAH7031613.1 hypothetical protein VCHA41O247_160070 [Vibrio chagasii]CAH7240645.1 hypothetical protein VCHA50P420_160025 [Vibrio chagasii]